MDEKKWEYNRPRFSPNRLIVAIIQTGIAGGTIVRFQ